MTLFRTILIIGRGLIGGSLGLDLERIGAAQSILYHDPLDPRSVPLTAVSTADVVIFATPVGAIPDLVQACQPFLREETILMDVASTKTKLIADLRPILGAQLAQFVFAHPIAGKPKSGFAEAEWGLFKGKPVVITPLAETLPAHLKRMEALWRAVGAETVNMTPEAHDAFYGRYSHLSNLLSFVLKAQWRQEDHAHTALLPPSFEAMALRADSSPTMWRDICLNNREEILRALHAFQADLSQLEGLIQQADPKALLDYLSSI